MYKKTITGQSSIRLNESLEGETIEMKIERVVNNQEPITDGAPIMYTERKDGVLPQYDVRTDRFDIAIDATDRITKAHLGRRQAAIDELNKKNNPEKPSGEISPEVSQ